MTITIHYEQSFRCSAGCGAWVNRIGQTCNRCLIRAEKKNAEQIKAEVRSRLDPGPLCDDDGRPAA